MIQTKFVEKIKIHILCSITFFRKSCRLWDIMKRYGTGRQATDDNIIRHIHIACCITKVTDTHSEYVIFITFLQQQWLPERALLLRINVTLGRVRVPVLFDKSTLSGTHPEVIPC